MTAGEAAEATAELGTGRAFRLVEAGVEALAARMPVPVEIGVAVGRPPATVEATAYFVVAEALTNVAKHARAQRAEVNARVEGGLLDIHVREEGVGGAQPHRGGLLALDDRLAVSAVSFGSTAQSEGGTLVAAANPLPAAEGAPVMRPSEHPSDVRTASPDVAGAAARVAASSARHR